MPICLACGKSMPRLQWSHFKNKCIGKFANSKEYILAYPHAKLIDDDLAKRTAITLENLCIKYGNEIGNQKWLNYKQKQAHSNSYEYKAAKHGWSREQFDEYNKNRAPSISNFIKKHGIEIGTVKWHEYCDRQAYTNSLEYFIEREGSREKGTDFWLNLNIEKSNPRNPEWISKEYKITLDEACQFISNRFKQENYVSESELQFVRDVQETLGRDIKYSALTSQFSIWDHYSNKIRFYDIMDSKSKKIIEFNGDYWHGNPNKYPHDWIRPHGEVPRTKLNEDDSNKKHAALDRGYDCLVIWESEYLDNRISAIEKAISFLNLEYEIYPIHGGQEAISSPPNSDHDEILSKYTNFAYGAMNTANMHISIINSNKQLLTAYNEILTEIVFIGRKSKIVSYELPCFRTFYPIKKLKYFTNILKAYNMQYDTVKLNEMIKKYSTLYKLKVGQGGNVDDYGDIGEFQDN